MNLFFFSSHSYSVALPHAHPDSWQRKLANSVPLGRRKIEMLPCMHQWTIGDQDICFFVWSLLAHECTPTITKFLWIYMHTRSTGARCDPLARASIDLACQANDVRAVHCPRANDDGVYILALAWLAWFVSIRQSLTDVLTWVSLGGAVLVCMDRMHLSLVKLVACGRIRTHALGWLDISRQSTRLRSKYRIRDIAAQCPWQ